MGKKPTKTAKTAKKDAAGKKGRIPATTGAMARKGKRQDITRKAPKQRKLANNMKVTHAAKARKVKHADPKLEWHWVSVKDIPEIWIEPRPREILVWGRIGHMKR